MATLVWRTCADGLFLGLSQFKKIMIRSNRFGRLQYLGLKKNELHIALHPVKDDEQSPESRSTGLI